MIGFLIVIIYSFLKGYFDLVLGEKIKSFRFIENLAEKVRLWMGESWKNKYKQIKLYGTEDYVFIPAPNNRYYRFFKLKYKEAFPLSATLFVAFTDNYHLISAIISFNLIFLICLYYSHSFWLFCILFLSLWMMNKIVFHLTYYRLFR